MKKFKLEVTNEGLKLISIGLGKLPFEHVSALIDDLQRQVDIQLQPADTQVPVAGGPKEIPLKKGK